MVAVMPGDAERPVGRYILSTLLCAVTVIVVLIHAAGPDDDTSNHGSRWTIHPSAHLAVVLAVLLAATGLAVSVFARGQRWLSWALCPLLLATAVATGWVGVQTSH